MDYHLYSTMFFSNRKAKLFLWLLIVFKMITVNCMIQYINLNDFVEGNLAYFQLSYPVNSMLDGTLLFDSIVTDKAQFYDVHLTEISNVGKRGDIVQKIDLDRGINWMEGTLYVREATLSVGQMYLKDSNQSATFTNAIVNLYAPAVDLSMSMIPDQSSCVLSVSLLLSLDEAYIENEQGNLKITDIFRETFLGFINSRLQNVTVHQFDGGCNGFDQLETAMALTNSRLQWH